MRLFAFLTAIVAATAVTHLRIGPAASQRDEFATIERFDASRLLPESSGPARSPRRQGSAGSLATLSRRRRKTALRCVFSRHPSPASRRYRHVEASTPMWMKFIRVKLNERVVVFKDGLPFRALGPGRHAVWGRASDRAAVFDRRARVSGVAGSARDARRASGTPRSTIAANERGIVYRDGKPAVFLRPGVHRLWTVDPSVRCEVHSIDRADAAADRRADRARAGERIRSRGGPRARTRPEVRPRPAGGNAGPGHLRLLVAPGSQGHGRAGGHAARTGRARRPGADDPRQGDAAAVAHGGIRRDRRGAAPRTAWRACATRFTWSCSSRRGSSFRA